ISGKINLMSQEDYLKMNPLASEEERKSSLKTRLETIKNNEGLDGSRIDIVLSDIDYNPQDLNEFSWDIPKNVTIMIDGCRVHNGMFEAEIDMSKDPHIYAFKKKKYRLTLSFDPRTAPDFIQDRIGWHGEGLTDKKYLDTKTIPGTRMIRKEWVIDREDLM
ncbi:MAG: hypothetical protein Q7N50_10415, partial [Armatimonadota bacterium]|nr:hypothetical protein [Armatimonadota bacterium]